MDSLCTDCGPELVTSFQRAGGTGAYPPPSLHALITTFLRWGRSSLVTTPPVSRQPPASYAWSSISSWIWPTLTLRTPGLVTTILTPSLPPLVSHLSFPILCRPCGESDQVPLCLLSPSLPHQADTGERTPSFLPLFQAFWLLDHEDWEEAVAMMLDPLLQVS